MIGLTIVVVIFETSKWWKKNGKYTDKEYLLYAF